MSVTDRQIQLLESHIGRSRSRPILWYLKISGLSQADCAYEITCHAIKCGLVGERSPVTGGALQDWVRKNKAPLWAVRAAMELALKAGWTPKEEYEFAVVAHLFVRCGGLVPKAMQCEAGVEWLDVAREADRRFQLSKKREVQ